MRLHELIKRSMPDWVPEHYHAISRGNRGGIRFLGTEASTEAVPSAERAAAGHHGYPAPQASYRPECMIPAATPGRR